MRNFLLQNLVSWCVKFIPTLRRTLQWPSSGPIQIIILIMYYGNIITVIIFLSTESKIPEVATRPSFRDVIRDKTYTFSIV